MATIKIALTGGIACGKSQFVDFFAKLGADVVRLDDIAKQVTTPNSDGLKALLSAFGKRIVNQAGELNRQVLREILLENESNKNRIELILHPKILKIMGEVQQKSQKKLFIVEIPLLFEKKLDYLFDRAIIIACNYEKQIERLKKRDNMPERLAKKMIFAQISPKDRLKAAEQMPSDIIENNADISNLAQQAKKLYAKLINL